MPQKSILKSHKSHKSFTVKPPQRVTFKRSNMRRRIKNFKEENLEAYLPAKERTKELKEKRREFVNALYNASKNGDDETVRKLVGLLDNEESDNYKLQQTMIADENGSTPLIWASFENHIKVVAELLKINSYIDAKNKDETGGYTALMIASAYGRVEIAKMLLDNHANVNIKDAEGATAIILASMRGHFNIVKLLLENGANINDKDNDGNTAILWACMKGHFNIVELLLENGANIDDEDNDGDTAIIWACIKGHFNIVELLLENGANINVKDNDGDTAILWACKKGYFNIVELLLNNGADFTISENSGETPFMHACSNGHLNIVQLLLSRIHPKKREAFINITDNAGHSALYWACTNGHENVVSFLLANGATDKCDELLNSPVHEGGKTRKLKKNRARKFRTTLRRRPT